MSPQIGAVQGLGKGTTSRRIRAPNPTKYSKHLDYRKNGSREKAG